MLNYLEVEDGFINWCKSDQSIFDEAWTILPNNVGLRAVAFGVLEFKPAKQSKTDIVISCGVHGNETAPIEIVSKLISLIVNGSLEPKVNLLFILGNPESMKIAERFVSINMNRLFFGAYQNYPLTAENRYELERARCLEEQVSLFFESGEKSGDRHRFHLDLHTAIKPSFHKTFAIRPFNEKPIQLASKQLLSAMGIEAVLQHNKPSTTFSYFSSAKFNAEAYTLELGKVKPFGENEPQDFVLAFNCLKNLIQDKSVGDFDSSQLVEYKVVAEIIRNSDDFKFFVADDVENFTAFPQGYLIAEDFDYNYRVAYSEEAVVFPNTNVPIGQRVAVMVTKVN